MVDRVGQFLGNYQLLRLLGSGAFADVYLAEHRYLEIPSAIKVLHVRLEPHTQEQFLREARTIAHLQHPHIVRVLDFGFHGEIPYLVIEYSPHGTLRSRHPKGTLLSLEQVIHYVKQIAPALDYAHQQRVIHRDVKPENMLLSANDEVVLSDFGIAVVQQSRDSLLTQNQAGTPLYMAPEQIQGKPTAASDQYALGVLVYEWLCGEPPFRGTLFEVFSKHLHEAPPSLCARVPSLPLAIEDAVFGALAKEPQARFVSVQEFAEVLEEVRDATNPLSVSLPSVPVSLQQGFPSDPLPAHTPAPLPEEERSASSHTPTLVLDRHPAQQEPFPVQDTKPVWRTNRQRLLRKVRTFWIAGVLEHSLETHARLALGLQAQPEAVANPWQLVVFHHPAGASRPLPAGTRITQVYDTANGELLILGAPGSGKTTLLLELARDLLERAEHDEQHPIPVVFTLSSWASRGQPLADWLVEELNRTYQVPRKLGQAMVEAEQILPLLDGLDEVAARERAACIEAINAYQQEHGLLPLVVCCRSADYLAQSARVQLGSAVAVQPLREEQVDDYLARGGEPLRALRMAVQQDPTLRELANTPLMLTILTLTYRGMSAEDLVRGASLTERQRQIFAHYVERMLRHRGAEKPYAPEQTTRWLSWLARQMKQHNQAVFYIEQLQFHWLSGDRALQAYDWLGVRVPGMLIGALVGLALMAFLNFADLPFSVVGVLLGGLLGELWSGRRAAQGSAPSDGKARSVLWPRILLWLGTGVLIGMIAAFTVGLDLRAHIKPGVFHVPPSQQQRVTLSGLLSVGLSFGVWNILLQLLRWESSTAGNSPSIFTTIWQRLVRLISRPGIGNGLLAGLLFVVVSATVSAVVYGLIAGSAVGLVAGLFIGLLVGLYTGLFVGASSGLLSSLLMGKGAMIQPVDQLIWSWGNLGTTLFSRRHIRPTVVVGLLFGLAALVITVLFSLLVSRLTLRPVYLESGLLTGLINGLSSALAYWLLLGFWQGVASATIEDQRRVIPNQGIRRSAYHGLALGLISAVIVGLTALARVWLASNLAAAQNTGQLAGPLAGLVTNLAGWPSTGLLAGLFAGLVAGLLNGGLACLRHSVLRFLLWRAGSIPWRYVQFLDEAAGHILLRKVGGGYIFVHRLLLEYFAALGSTTSPPEARARKQFVRPGPREP
jgi:serine/threonine protein kinase/DNA polymerase III delta prime subunit